jgi:hypothetical protein
MLKLERLTGTALTLVVIGFALAGVALALDNSRSLWPDWLKNDWVRVEQDALKYSGGQVAGILKVESQRNQPFGLVLGSSTADCGLDTNLLENTTTPRRQWFRLSSFNTSTHELEILAGLAFGNGLKPDVLLLCMDAWMLARSPTGNGRVKLTHLGAKWSRKSDPP